MKKLIAYYSRTGNTQKVAEILAQKLGADKEEIKDTTDRSGIKGYLISGRDAMKKRLTQIEPLNKNISEYDLVIIGTPIWGWNMSVPIRTFLTNEKNNFQKVAFFCTMGGSGDQKAFQEMGEIINQSPLATLALLTRNVVKNNFEKGIEEFIENLKTQ